jgi:hypothetical protein
LPFDLDELSKKQPTLMEIIQANRTFIMALLMMPIFGMIIAVILILYKRPDNMFTALGVIGFLIVQYGFTIYYFSKRLLAFAENQSSEEDESSE